MTEPVCRSCGAALCDCPISVETLRVLIGYNPLTGELFRRDPATGFIEPIDRIDGGYIRFEILGRKVRGHRVAWALWHGSWPEGEIDHINGDRADNRIENLRAISPRQNSRNKRIPQDHATGCVGVEKRVSLRGVVKWRASIHFNKRKVRLGQFNSIEEAITARLKAEREYGYPDGQPRIDRDKVLRVASEDGAAGSVLHGRPGCNSEKFPHHEDASA